MDGKCFCCNKKISYEKWECGHIHAEKHGGEIKEENLKPICKHCNKSMSAQHMYLYMFLNKLEGLKNLDMNDDIVKLKRMEAEVILSTTNKIDQSQQEGHLGKTKAEKMKRDIHNRRINTEGRLVNLTKVNNELKNNK
jgi:hypothetical protein